VPVQVLLEVTDWQSLFLGLGAATAALAAAVFLIVPEHDGPIADPSLREQFDGLRQVFRDRLFRRIAPAAAVTIGVSLSIQSLWAGPWLQDVQGLAPLAVASHLMVAAATQSLGFPVAGLLTQRCAR